MIIQLFLKFAASYRKATGCCTLFQIYWGNTGLRRERLVWSITCNPFVRGFMFVPSSSRPNLRRAVWVWGKVAQTTLSAPFYYDDVVTGNLVPPKSCPAWALIEYKLYTVEALGLGLGY